MKSFEKILAVLLACLMAFSVLSAAVFADETDGTPAVEDTSTTDTSENVTEDTDENELISVVDVTVAAPVDGEYADGLCIVNTLNTALNSIEWVDVETGDILYSSDPNADVVDTAFFGGYDYSVNIVLTAGEGYAFDSAENLSVTVNGADAELVDVSENGKVLLFTLTFSCGETGGDDDEGPAVNFDQILNFLKTLLLTFVRFLGSLVGIK